MNLSDFNLSNFKQNIKNDLFENLFNSFLTEINNYLNKNEQTLNSNIDYFTIDRIEENYAVLENRSNQQMSNVPITKLPDNIQNGQVLKFQNNSYVIDYELTKQALDTINEKSNKLFE